MVLQALATQADVHRQWGGVVPTLAKEAHAASIDATVDEALAQARVSAADLAAIAVTVGPGLLMCLHVSALLVLHRTPFQPPYIEPDRYFGNQTPTCHCSDIPGCMSLTATAGFYCHIKTLRGKSRLSPAVVLLQCSVMCQGIVCEPLLVQTGISIKQRIVSKEVFLKKKIEKSTCSCRFWIYQQYLFKVYLLA